MVTPISMANNGYYRGSTLEDIAKVLHNYAIHMDRQKAKRQLQGYKMLYAKELGNSTAEAQREFARRIRLIQKAKLLINGR